MPYPGRRRNKSPDEVYAEAIDQVDLAQRRLPLRLYLGKGRRSFMRLPPLGSLRNLYALNLARTGITDISPLADVPSLRVLSLSDTRVSDIGSLSALVHLENLDLSASLVADISSLSSLAKINTLDLSNTAVSNLEALRDLKSLRVLYLRDVQVPNLEPISHLENLEALWIENSPVEDLSAIARLTSLKRLWLADLNVRDLNPLRDLTNIESLQMADMKGELDLSAISNLKKLHTLIVPRCRLSSFESLAGLEQLRDVSLYGANIVDLSPFANLSSLRSLNIRFTEVRDVSPIGGLRNLRSLPLDDTQVSDLAPLAEVLSLIEGAKRRRTDGVSFFNCPITDPILRAMSQLNNPTRTIEVLNYIRKQQKLPAAVEKNPESRLIWEDLATHLDQSALGVRFEISNEHFEIATSDQKSDRDAADNPVTRQLHEQIKIKAADLANRAMRLANRPDWQSLASASDRFNDLMQTDIETISGQIGVVWGEVVSLGSFLELDDTLRGESDAVSSPLDADIRRPLADLLQTAGPWLRRFPTARELDEEHSAFQASREVVEPARDIIAAAEAESVIDEEAAGLLDGALRASVGGGRQSNKASGWGVFSVRNLLVGAVGLAAAGTVTGVFKEIGSQIAQHSILAQKSIRLMLSSEEIILTLLADLPADVRLAVRSLLDDLKRQRGGSEFPLPQKPEEIRNRRRRRLEE